MGVYASRFVLLECLRFSSCTYRVSTLLAVRSLSAYDSRFDLSVGPTTGFTSELALLQQRKKKGKSVLGKKQHSFSPGKWLLRLSFSRFQLPLVLVSLEVGVVLGRLTE